MRIEKERGEIDASKKDKQEDIDRYEYEAREELDRLIEDEQDPTMKTDTDDDEAVATAQSETDDEQDPMQKFTFYSITGPVTEIPARSGGESSANCGSDGFVTGGGFVATNGIAITLSGGITDSHAWKVEGYNKVDVTQPLKAIAMCIKPAL
jgi:hypothetical protein